MIIAPSLLAANFLNLQAECQMLNESEADWFHLDVMDGRFVPNISYGFPVIEQVRKTTKKICDVHLMIEEPGKYAEAFRKAGADILTVHYEACPHLHRNIQQIKAEEMMFPFLPACAKTECQASVGKVIHSRSHTGCQRRMAK